MFEARISQSINILPQEYSTTWNVSYGKIVEQTGFFNLGMATKQGERKFWIQTC